MLSAAPVDGVRVPGLLRSHWRSLLLLTLAGVVLRVMFVLVYPGVTDDGVLYLQLARNLLTTHHYLRWLNGHMVPSTARLPGYPLFLAVVLRCFGRDNLLAVWLIQVGLDIGTAAAAAALTLVLLEAQPQARRHLAAVLAYGGVALCPFLAMYTAAILSETPAVLCTTLALLFGWLALQRGAWRWWWGAGLALAVGIQMRPDTGLVLLVLDAAALTSWGRRRPQSQAESRPRPRLAALLLLNLVSLLPVALWTVRNAVVLHVFRPLVSSDAEEVGEPTHAGLARWTCTWLSSYRQVEDFLSDLPASGANLAALPPWAFDSAQQRAATQALLDRYAANRTMTPELDAAFMQLAQQRIRAHPLRYALVLPLLRARSLWLSPRVEFLPITDQWWPPGYWFEDDPHDFGFTLAYLVLNVLWLGLAAWGVWHTPMPGKAWLVGLVLTRTFALSLYQSCEPRYTLELYPLILIWAAMALTVRMARLRPASPVQSD